MKFRVLSSRVGHVEREESGVVVFNAEAQGRRELKVDVTSRMVIEPELSQRLRVFGFVSALLIVLIHSTPNPALGTWQWWVAELVGHDGLCRIAVPYFFLAGGFFLAGHVCEECWWKREVNKRVRTLAIPYFLWIGIGLLVHFGLWFGIQKVGKVCGFPNPFYGPMHIWIVNTFGINPFVNKIGILWFVRDLFALVVLSPFLLFMLKRFKWFFIAIIFVLYGAVAILQIEMDKGWYNFFEYFISLRGLCYFVAGLGLRYVCVAQWIKYIKIIGILSLMMLVGKIILIRYSHLEFVAAIDVFMVPALMAGLFYVLDRIKFPTWITGNAFAVYLIHQNFLLFSIVAISLLNLRPLMDTSIVIWLLRFAFAVFMSIAIACCMRRFLPRVANLLFGGR